MYIYIYIYIIGATSRSLTYILTYILTYAHISLRMLTNADVSAKTGVELTYADVC